MARDSASQNGQQKPVGGKLVSGGAKGQPAEQSQMITGNDLRAGKGK